MIRLIFDLFIILIAIVISVAESLRVIFFTYVVPTWLMLKQESYCYSISYTAYNYTVANSYI